MDYVKNYETNLIVLGACENKRRFTLRNQYSTNQTFLTKVGVANNTDKTFSCIKYNEYGQILEYSLNSMILHFLKVSKSLQSY